MKRALAVVCLLVAGEAGAQEPDLEALVKTAPRCDPARKHCFGLRLHVAVGEQGVVAAADWVARQLEFANRHFAAIDVGFQVAGVSTLPASAARIEDASERTSLAPLVAGTVIDVFVTGQLDDIDIKGGIIYGVTWPTGAKKYVIISAMAWERTLAHEFGHVFGLPHSNYAISLMNKRQREKPPLEERTFHPDEIATMKVQLARMLREKVIADMAPAPAPAPAPPALWLPLPSLPVPPAPPPPPALPPPAPPPAAKQP
jgi:hypothetical protein